MASTNKTPHLGLCQWEATDPFLREDMNDTLKTIDTEIETRTTKKKLFDVTVEESVPALELDFTGIDTSQFMELEIYMQVGVERLSMRLNGNTDNVYTITGTSGSSTLSRFEIPNGLSRLSLGTKQHIFRPPYPISQVEINVETFPRITSFNIFGNGYGNAVYAGSRIIIWGVLK